MALGTTAIYWRRIAVLVFFTGTLLQLRAEPVGGTPVDVKSQEQSDSSNRTTYVVTGTVVDSVQGEGIRGSLVQLSGDSQDVTLTDAGGQFRFEGLASNVVIVTAKKPGFFTEQDMLRHVMLVAGQNRNQPAPAAKPVTGPVIIKLVAEAIIFGRVLGYRNEPIESLPVVVSIFGMFDGRKTSVQIANAVTDENGRFRISGLIPQNYYVAAGPGPAQVVRESGGAAKGYEGYPVVFYPAASDRDGAVPVSVGAGTRTEVDFSIAPQPFFRISGSVHGYGAGQQAYIQFAGTTTLAFAGLAPCDPATGAFTSNWIPGGSYILRVGVSGPSEFPMSASQYLTVDTNISDLRIQVQPAITIPINVRVETTRDSSSDGQDSVMVTLMPKGPQGGVESDALIGRLAARTGALWRVEAGAYLAKLATAAPWYVQSAMYGTQDILRDDLVIGLGGSRPVEIVVRDDGAVLNGTTTSDGHPSRSSVLIVPEQSPSQLRMIVTNQEGAFQVGGLAPGTYHVIAFDNADDLEYRNPAAITDYLMKAHTILLNASQTARVSLELVKRGN
jgi:hypothetical protein